MRSACSHVPKPLLSRLRYTPAFAAAPPQAMDAQPNAQPLTLANTVLPFLLPPSQQQCAGIYSCAEEQVFERTRCSLLAACGRAPNVPQAKLRGQGPRAEAVRRDGRHVRATSVAREECRAACRLSESEVP